MYGFNLGVVFLMLLTVLLDATYATGFKGRSPIKAPDNFMEWCEADELFKPYVKYYYGGRLEALRKGKPDVTHGPGHHYDFLSQKNTYVCINGLAWMYYAKIQSGSVPVLVQPELHIYEHNCMLTNFEIGPGRTEPWANDSVPIPMLYSILLMGDKDDYRNPSIELMTAPTAQLVLVDKSGTKTIELRSPVKYVNGTSLVMIGDDTECILQKGQSTIRIRSGILGTDHLPDPNKPEEALEYGGTFCKFSYSTLGPTAKDANVVDASTAPAGDATEKEVIFAAKALQNSGDLAKKGCFVPNNYTASDKDTVVARKAQLEDLKNFTADPKSVLQERKVVMDKVHGWSPTVATTPPAPPGPPGKEDQEVVKGGSLKFKDLIPAADPCSTALSPVPAFCNPSPCDPAIPDTMACPDTTTGSANEHCDPCDMTHPGVKAIIKRHLDNIAARKTVNPVVPADILTATEEIAKIRFRGCQRNLWEPTERLGVGTATAGVYADTVKAWDIAADMKPLDDYLEAVTKLGTTPTNPAAAYDAAKKEVFDKKQLAAAAVSKAEGMRSDLESLLKVVSLAYKDFNSKANTLAGGGVPNCGKKDAQSEATSSGVITIKRDSNKDGYIQTNNQSSKDPTAYPPDTKKTCGKLPATPVSCKNAKPGEKRACQLLNARMGIYVPAPSPGPPSGPQPGPTPGRKKRQATQTGEGWASGDEWREGILSTIADIFSKACGPMVKEVFANDINKVIKGYLINYVEGTLKNESIQVPDVKCCAAAKAACYGRATGDAATIATAKTACDTAETGCIDPATPTPECPLIMEECESTNTVHKTKLGTEECKVAPLPIRRQYWDQLTHALKDCKAHERVLQFKRIFKDDDRDQPDDAFVYKLMGKPWKELVVEDNIEQADAEYAFNYVIDSLWRMFATTMALCMPYIEKPLPDVTRQYYALFTEDFLYPLAKEWRNNRDNPVFELILGAYYEKRTDYWVKKCMEAAFMRTGDIRWRPPRKLLVNGLSEMNYFIQGPVHKLTLPKGFYYK